MLHGGLRAPAEFHLAGQQRALAGALEGGDVRRVGCEGGARRVGAPAAVEAPQRFDRLPARPGRCPRELDEPAAASSTSVSRRRFRRERRRRCASSARGVRASGQAAASNASSTPRSDRRETTAERRCHAMGVGREQGERDRRDDDARADCCRRPPGAGRRPRRGPTSAPPRPTGRPAPRTRRAPTPPRPAGRRRSARTSARPARQGRAVASAGSPASRRRRAHAPRAVPRPRLPTPALPGRPPPRAAPSEPQTEADLRRCLSAGIARSGGGRAAELVDCLDGLSAPGRATARLPSSNGSRSAPPER